MKRKLFFLPLLFICVLGYAQQINWQEVLPTDPAVHVGKLPNGITYYLRQNKEPKERASFYIIRNAGALLEKDNQDGLAHFLEHMAFNGSKNFPGNSMIATLERHGVSFGGNLNAYTTQNETVYNISDVPVTNEALVDTCLLILHDWSYYLTLDPKELDEERGVILEEWRTRNSSSSRLRNKQLGVLLKGSQYAERDVIGDTTVIKTFKPKTIKNFYHEWYRTDLEAIAIVGDFDIKEMEAKIKAVFSSIPAVKKPKPVPFFEIPSHEEMYYCLATDKEATSSSVQLIRLFRDEDANGTVTYQDIKDGLMQNFYNTMISHRISEMIQRGNAPFLSASIGFGGMVRGYAAYSVTTKAKPNQEKEALEAVLQENNRILQHGFTDSELERAKTNMVTALKSALKDLDKTTNEQHISDMQSNFLSKAGMISTEDYVAAALKIIPTITAAEVAAQAKKWWKADNRTVLVSGPSEGVTHLTEQEARDIIAANDGKAVEAYKDNTVSGSLLSPNEVLKGSKVVATKALPEFQAVEWTLENGTKIVYRKADFEKDNVALSAYSFGGSSLYDDIDLLPAASNAGSLVDAYGIGDYDAIQLKKLMTGKQAACSVGIGGLSESVAAACSPQDFETMMQLLYLRFMKPRFDKQVHDVIMSQNRIRVQQMAGQPQVIMQDSVNLIASNYHPRTLLFNDSYLDKLTIDRIEKVYRERFANVADFTFFIVGNIDEEIVKPMVEKYIGSINASDKRENWVDHKIRGPKGKTEKVIKIPLEVSRATVLVSFRKEMPFALKDDFANTILSNILSNRYTKTIREEQGGTYGVGVSGGVSREPVVTYSMQMNFDCDPARYSVLKPLIYKEIDNIIKNGVTEEELSKVVKNILKESAQGKEHNSYWMTVIKHYYRRGVNINDPKNYEDILTNMKPADIQDFTKRMFKDANVIDLVFEPVKK